MRVKNITTYSGQAIDLNKLTVLVGPNNSGKSQTLKDIKSTLEIGRVYTGRIIKDVLIEWPKTFDEFSKDLRLYNDPNSIHNQIISGLKSDLLNLDHVSFGNDLSSQYDKGFINKDESLLGPFTKFSVAYLSSENRLQLGSSVDSIDPEIDLPTKILQTIVNDFNTEKDLLTAFKEAFAMEIMFDVSGYRQFKFRVAEKLPDIPENPRKASGVTNIIPLLDEQGDGFRSFVGMVIGLLKSKDRIILLDEPEAFLHPAQARFFGYWITTNIDKFSSQIIISTHSSNFLHGILSGQKDVTVYRLNRRENNTSFDLIPAETCHKLSKHPMLSSQRVLEAIFHKGAVVCEADADRAIYHTVARILFDNQELLFIHGHSKDSLWQVVEVLKEARVAVSTITDIDILNAEISFKKLVNKSSGSSFTEDIESSRKKIAESVNSISEKELLEKLRQEVTKFLEEEHTLSGARSALKRIEKAASKWSTIKSGGKDAFEENVREDVKTIFEYCKSIGIFIVPVGELEGWIKLDVTKKKWFVTALEEIYNGQSPENLGLFVKEVLDYFSTDSIGIA